MDAKYGKKETEVSNGTLATILQSNATAALAKQIRDELQKSVDSAQAEVNSAKADREAATRRENDATLALVDAKAALNVWDTTIGKVVVVDKRDRKYFHLDSRTDKFKPGHFIEAIAEKNYVSGWNLNNVSFTCTCEAGANGRTCWAVDQIKWNLNKGDYSFNITEEQYKSKNRDKMFPMRGARLPYGGVSYPSRSK